MAFLAQFFLQELIKETVEVAVVVTAAAATTYVGAKVVEGTYEVISNAGSSSSSSSSTGFYLPERAIWDWWGNGLSGTERERLLSLGYNDRSGCFQLDELKGMLRLEEKLGKPPVNAPGWERKWEPPKDWDGRTLKKEPRGQRRGYPHKDGSVWVPKDGHGGPQWEVERPDGSHEHVYPDGRVRKHK
jgi:hypothetical protein